MLMLMVFTAMSITLSTLFPHRDLLALRSLRNGSPGIAAAGDSGRSRSLHASHHDHNAGPAENPASGLTQSAPGDAVRRRHRQTRGMTEQREPESDKVGKVVVVGSDGVAVESDASDASGERPVTEMVEQPAKVMRVGSMIRQLLEEVRAAPLDEKSRARLKEIHTSSIKELEDGLAPDLVEELERLSLPFAEDEVPSEAELRVAQAQLVGWLEGLFHGIQTTLFAQQMAARAQLEQMRRALPPGMMPSSEDAQQAQQQQRASGPYL